jgi:hypothetical protein
MLAASSGVLTDCALEEWVNGIERVNFSAEGDDAKDGAGAGFDTSARPLIEPKDITDTVDGRRAMHTW